jgi:hypothetical protein
VGRDGAHSAVVLDPADDLVVRADERNILRFSDAEGPVGAIFAPHGHRVDETGAITVLDMFAFRLVADGRPLPPRDDVRERIDRAFTRGHLGAEVVVARPGRDGTVTAYDNLTVSVDAQEGRLRAVVSAPGVSGRTLIFHVANAVLEGTSLAVTLDGHAVGEASNITDALDPDDDGLSPEWFAVEGTDGVTAFISLPHFSEWEIEIQSIAIATPAARPILGAAGAAAVVLIAGALLVRGRKRDEL